MTATATIIRAAFGALFLLGAVLAVALAFAAGAVCSRLPDGGSATDFGPEDAQP